MSNPQQIEMQGQGNGSMLGSGLRSDDDVGEGSYMRPGYRKIKVANGRAEPILRDREPAYAPNSVITSEYTPLTFLPINLWQQFAYNRSNCYFFLIGLLQVFPSISASGGTPDMWLTLFIIIVISAVRAAVEDYGKHKSDRKRNSALYDTLNESGKFVPVKSGRIKTGQIVRVKKNQMIPCDMLFMGSALKQGHCFLDRANLNGETALEVYNSMGCTRGLCARAGPGGEELYDFAAELEYEGPNKRFDEFSGELRITGGLNGKVENEKVDGRYLLMRETNLRNCDYIYGLVVYTGDDTKIQRSNMSGEKERVKQSKITKLVNKLLVCTFLAQVVLCCVGAALNVHSYPESKEFYLMPNPPEDVDSDGTLKSVQVFLTTWLIWLQILSQMVPVSLVLTGEMVKYLAAKIMQNDRRLYYPDINKKCRINRSTIHEDLGLIDYVFSDKTGTLTQNKMEFRFMKVGEGPQDKEEYGSKETEIARSVARRKNELQNKIDGKHVGSATWTELEAPLIFQAKTEMKDDSCCTCWTRCFELSCCKWLLELFWNGEPLRSDDVPENILPGNFFSQDEKQQVLSSLWGGARATETEAEAETRRYNLRRFMTHMALSNTIKPFIQDGQLEFQAESAEELAMAKFAMSLGFTKKSVSPTILEVQEYDENLREKGEPVVETYNHLATFGFTSKRARVSVIYEKITTDEKKREILVMTKGQDTVILPLLKSVEDRARSEEQLNTLANNGLRTLVCAHATVSSEWWLSRQERYTELSEMELTEDSEGHSDGTCNSEKCRECLCHAFFEKAEEDAELRFLGLMGLEDQLQLLVPECIKDCIHANIRVWMITGDKLETARNIGLACNLIDPDMQPVFKHEYELKKCIELFNETRLIEVTGAWSSLSKNKEELGKLFDTIDYNRSKNGLAKEEIQGVLNALKCGVDSAKIDECFDDFVNKQTLCMDKEGFIQMMAKTDFNMFEAVKFDIEQGIETFKGIKDHHTYPISMLINREAFLVMFPEMADQVSESKATPEQLEHLRSMFFTLANVSKSVVFARAQPAMKKRMVTEVMLRTPEAITLAIGDGANDTDMIKAAHVGVGISGVEGTAAVNSADYAIGTFRMLHSLLFVHGYWSYKRISIMVNFLCYKAVFQIIPCYYYGFYSKMSAQRLWDPLSSFCFNLFYTATPIMTVALFDQALKYNTLQDSVAAYRENKGKSFNTKVFAAWIFRAFLHGTITWFLCYYCARDSIMREIGNSGGGFTMDIWYFELQCYFPVVLVSNLIIILEMHNITFVHAFCLVVCSFASMWAFPLISSYVTLPIDLSKDIKGVVEILYSQPEFYLICFLAASVPIIVELFFRACKQIFRPTLSNILQERQQSRKYTELLDESQEQEWRKRKKSNRHEERFNKASQKLQKIVPAKTKPGEKDQQRNAIVRSMLRFRNLTGGQYESAANAHYGSFDRLSVVGEAPKGT